MRDVDVAAVIAVFTSVVVFTSASSSVAMLARAARRLTEARVPWASAAAALGASASCALADGGDDDDDDDVLEVVNWSATHSARPTAVYTPESVADVEALVAAHAARKARLRPCGSALSPNGLALSAVWKSNIQPDFNVRVFKRL